MSDARAHEILALVLEHPEDRRAAFLDDVCDGDPELRTTVEEFLKLEEHVGGFLDKPAIEAVEDWQEVALEAGEVVGRYTVVRRLGAGGGGTVYLTEQKRPKRQVALKVMRLGLTASGATARRFEQEIEHLAKLNHPHIAHVYDVGAYEGVPYFVLEYVEGERTLTQFASEHSLSTRQRMDLAAHVCDALQHAHENDILHRDLKPANVLVDPEGRPKVIDFGIGLLLELEKPGRDIAGTLPYMSPEQMDTGLDVRSDVYALGVVMYELLTGRLPHDVATAEVTDAVETVRKGEVAPPGIDAEVDAIVGKAMHRVREQRYASAAELAEDIRSYLRGDLVQAHPHTVGYRLRTWLRRNRAAAWAGLIVVLALAGAMAATTRSAQQAAVESKLATKARTESRFRSYAADIAAADAALRAHDFRGARRRLRAAPREHRGWEWSLLAASLDVSTHTFDTQQEACQTLAIAPGRIAVTGVTNRRALRSAFLQVWDTATNRMVEQLGPTETAFRSLDWSPEKDRIAAGHVNGTIWLVGFSPFEIKHQWRAHDSAVVCVHFDAGDDTLVSADENGTVRAWKGDRPERFESVYDAGVGTAGAAVNRQWIALGCGDATVRLWDRGANELTTLRGHEDAVTSVALSSDRSLLVSGSRDTTVRLWEPESGRARAILRGHGACVCSVGCSDDGARAAAGYEDGTIRLWDTNSGTVVGDLNGHTHIVFSVRFLPDSHELLSVANGTAKRWPTQPWTQGAELARVGAIPRHITYSDDGKWIACALYDGTVEVYDARTHRRIQKLRGPQRRANAVAFASGGNLLAVASNDTMVQLWSTNDWKPLEVLRGHTGPAKVATFSPDGKLLASGAKDGVVILWEVKARRELHRLRHDEGIESVGFCRDGAALAATTRGHELVVWDVEKGQQLYRRDAGSGSGTGDSAYPRALLAVSPDGTRIATAARKSPLKLWDAASGDLLASFGPLSQVRGVAFSPDGSRLACADGWTLRLFTGESLTPLVHMQHTAWVQSVAWSPDGTQLVSSAGAYGGRDRSIRLWGRQPGKPWPPTLKDE